MNDLRFALRQLLKQLPFTAVAGALLIVAPLPVDACTIFVLTDANRALFFNNEDWFNPATRLWFVPSGKDHLGCAYLGFGYGSAALERELGKSPAPTVANGAAILRACLQPGDGGTKYSNVFDLKSGDMVLFLFPGRDEGVTLNLEAELAKGAHYYDIATIREQLTAAPQPLLNNMRRFYLDEFAPLADQEPAVTERVRAIIRDTANGTMLSEDYAAEFWSALAPQQKKVQAELKRLGDLGSLTLVGRHDEAARREYRYRVEFDRMIVLQRFVFDEQNKVKSVQSEASELKPGATLRTN